MANRALFGSFALLWLFCGKAEAQTAPGLNWTLLPREQMDEIIGEASGETAWNTIMETGGYNKDRQAEEYAGTFYEARYVHDQLKAYRLPGAEIVRFPGREVWDGVKGELWEVHPQRRKLASYRDLTAMLARGSVSADVKAELVWVGRGTEEEMEGLDLAGKIVVTEGSMNRVHASACMEKNAAGVVAISRSRPYFDPIQIPWSGISGNREGRPAKFGFYLTARDGDLLKERLLRGEKITVHAQVEARMEPYELQDVVGHIPGTDPEGQEIIFSAHLFEGIVKQGANDNKSGSAAILEVARVLHTLIEEGRLPRPKRTIRFLWGPEFSGTAPWVKASKALMDRTLCNINMDMVGEWLSRHQASMCLIRTTYGHAHYINDVMENYFRFVGEGNRERIHGHRSAGGTRGRIVAPTGADEPFHYIIETHFGSSDHEVFNDWGVQVPGVMMIAWPDQWFHTSGDRVDKADPTQLKRVVVIGAAAAYTVAAADDAMAVRIAGEMAANGTRRLGHQFMHALEDLNTATVETFREAYRTARVRIDCARANEKASLRSILELAEDEKRVGSHVDKMGEMIDRIGSAHLAALESHMQSTAARLNQEPVAPAWTDLEAQASKRVPKPLARIKENGYGGYRELISGISEAERERFPYSRRAIASTSELMALIDGKRSALDIKNALDAQYTRSSELQSVLNYLELLKRAGLIEM